MGLKAIHPILYLSHQYAPDDELPANDPSMMQAWIAAGTAEWTEPPKEEIPAAEPPKEETPEKAAVEETPTVDNTVTEPPKEEAPEKEDPKEAKGQQDEKKQTIGRTSRQVK